MDTKITETDVVGLQSPDIELVQPGDRSLTVVASNPMDMALAQSVMIDRVELRIRQSESEEKLAHENLDQAKKSKIKTSAWRRMVVKYQKEAVYYRKVLQALKEGYFVIPDLPVALIAIRTNKTAPTHDRDEVCGMNVRDEAPALLPAGEGDYVAPEVVVKRWTEEREKSDGRKHTQSLVRAVALDQVDFPIKAVRPEVLSELGRAQSLRLFDAIGILPADIASRKRDPMLIGIVSTQKERMNGWSNGSHVTGGVKAGHKRMCFLLKWWLDLDSI